MKPWDFDQQACAGEDSVLFFPPDEGKGYRPPMLQEYKEAKKICLRCVHIDDCADWAIPHEQYGVWGGLTPGERSVIRSRRKKSSNDDSVLRYA